TRNLAPLAGSGQKIGRDTCVVRLTHHEHGNLPPKGCGLSANRQFVYGKDFHAILATASWLPARMDPPHGEPIEPRTTINPTARMFRQTSPSVNEFLWYYVAFIPVFCDTCGNGAGI